MQYAAYNLWANQQLVEKINNLHHKLPHTEVVSSFSSLHLTLKHLKEVELIWWERMRLTELALPLPEDTSTTAEIGKQLLDLSKQWKDWIDKSTNAAFEHEFVYRNSKKEQFKQPVFQMLLHLFNHQNYHRGQIVTIMRQLGVEQIPATDFIVWSRRKSK